MSHPDFSFICFYCDKIFPIGKKTDDHFIARSKGGKRLANIVPSCRYCNGSKSDKSPTKEQMEKF